MAAIAEGGTDVFYRGAIARRLAEAARIDRGLMTEADLAAHRSDWVAPLCLDYRGWTIHELPPNGQGLAALIALGMLRHLDLAAFAPDSADSLHLQIEAMKVGFAIARSQVADPQAMPVPAENWIDDAFLASRAEAIRMDRAAAPEIDQWIDHGTVYRTAADAEGRMVSMIQSNFPGFGSGIVVPGTGISMQNRGHGFSTRAGHPNAVAGGKRPYHTIIPGFITRGGQPLASFGVMGGHMQPQGHVQMVDRLADYGQNPQAAADAPRWQLCEDGPVALEPGFPEGLEEALAARGHRLLDGEPVWGCGGAQLIWRLERGYLGASDPRKDGQAVGF